MSYLKKDQSMLTKKLEKSGDDSAEAREDLEMDIGEVDRRINKEPKKSVSMSVKKESKPKKSAKAKKYDFCYQYPISQHRGYNNASGRVYMNCGLNQYKGAVKIDNTQLPEPDYVNPEAIKREQKELNKGLNPDSYTKGTKKEVSTGGLFVEGGGVFGLQDLVTETNNELANEMTPEPSSAGAYDVDDSQSQLEVPAKFALSNKPKKVKLVEMYDNYPS
jgi:hypothetical protein